MEAIDCGVERPRWTQRQTGPRRPDLLAQSILGGRFEPTTGCTPQTYRRTPDGVRTRAGRIHRSIPAGRIRGNGAMPRGLAEKRLGFPTVEARNCRRAQSGFSRQLQLESASRCDILRCQGCIHCRHTTPSLVLISGSPDSTSNANIQDSPRSPPLCLVRHVAIEVLGVEVYCLRS